MEQQRMDFGGLQQALGTTPGINPGGPQQAGQDGGGNAGFQELEDGRVVVSREDFDEMQRGYLRQQDYTTKTQSLADERRQVEQAKTMLTNVIDQYNAAVRAGQLTPEQAQAAGQKIGNAVQDLRDGRISPEMRQILMQQDSRIEMMLLKEEATALRQAHPNMDQAAYNAVVAKAIEMQEAAGPGSKLRVSLEDAYYMVHGRSIEQVYSAVQKKQEEAKKKNWQSPASGGGFVRPKGMKSPETREDARRQSERILAEFINGQE